MIDAFARVERRVLMIYHARDSSRSMKLQGVGGGFEEGFPRGGCTPSRTKTTKRYGMEMQRSVFLLGTWKI